MPQWKEKLLEHAHTVETHYDWLRWQLKQRFHLIDPVTIQPYHGYGYQNRVYMKGRVLEERGIDHPTAEDSGWDNLVAMYHRFESDEIARARVRVRLYDEVQEVVTNNEGYFDVWFHQVHAPPERIWHEVTLELLDKIAPEQESVQVTGRVLLPPPPNDFVVVSDIDDTILQSQATDTLTMARLTLFKNARTRVPFPGIAAFYRALQQGVGEATFNPLFYLSSNAWNMYEFLEDFIKFHNIPMGPLLLRDFGLTQTRFLTSSHHEHKFTYIKNLLDLYPSLDFILIGDSGAKDAEIYAHVVNEFPHRIAAIYIRDVTPDHRDAEVQALAEEVTRAGSMLCFVEDTYEAAQHAAAHGFIDAASLPHIQEQVAKDTGTAA